MKNEAIVQRARTLFNEALVWDGHSGFMPDPAADLNNLQRWRNAGVHYLSVDVGFDVLPWTQTVENLAVFRHWILDHSDDYLLVERPEDILRARREGRLGITFDIEGMNALNGRVEMVEFYHRLGVRQMLFAYNRNNLAGGGCHDEDIGLTAFGREVIDEMNRLGMFVDVSHCSYRTSMEAMEYSQQPVIFSHSNPRQLTPHGRNITDEQILACVKTGGLIGVNGIGGFLGCDQPDAARFADHIDYLLNLAGPRHVGIALDYAFPVGSFSVEEILANHAEYWPAEEYQGGHGYVAPEALFDVTAELLARGHSEKSVKAVLGENFLRLAHEIWK
ncbi:MULTISPECIES: dipeptidase [Erwinia]|uniref:Membrane dipeptidase n=1 Tax=Erwinia rhapontici TaxID=55212 RepID=A0ABN6DJT5_ERWRD|nr:MULTISPECIES: membrane dipeptidase [Erwinia]MCS3606199.1 membrane dipeptidase [Erwinia rhapontici]NNS05680.1 membrane dipeptidase [Erwinia sp. JH02]TDT02560.1 membrane dipeptidase [Erwinia rhapontici]BCQ35065.1 membrane dipeptidase [Erwinia rhapontici]BCQ45168.1 membrane dipeptidase [Erwinia rhapontici]